MRILLIMNPGIPVPPKLYGGIERIVYLLAEECHRLGHEVTLLAGPDSYCSGTTITFGSNKAKQSKWDNVKEIAYVWKFLRTRHKNFDLIHNFGRLIYFLPILNTSANKIMSYQRQVSTKGIKFMSDRPNRHLTFTGCSSYCVSTGNIAGRWAVVYNALDFSKYSLNENVPTDAPLMFLGRLDEIKGVHTAIDVAKASGHTLWIGGNIPTTADNYAYYKKEIEPEIDGKQIIYLGELNDQQKNQYLGKAKALLFPIEWDEPFGIVMIEAMACGTPVIAFKRGAVPEVIEARTGIIVENFDEMVQAVSLIEPVDRKICKQTAQGKFDISIITLNYLALVN